MYLSCATSVSTEQSDSRRIFATLERGSTILPTFDGEFGREILLTKSFFGDGEEGILADGAGNEPSGTFAVKRGKFLNSACDKERFCPIFGCSTVEKDT
jgi:hypothetical protein